ncbi:taste receptor type 2 member 40-like [Hyla sarda]|uniref:taste receptor type 2 member 40-like n=1 Tax=Hyla sarda TaxID=327740 RepID=UPI0024C3C8B7|nr:taste receptor type 2 member 40-like [Hyla sarda]
MLPLFIVASLTALCASSFIGFFTNSFIILNHSKDIMRGKMINPRELIFSILGLFNIFYQCTLLVNDIVLFLWTDMFFSDKVQSALCFILLFTIFSSFWFTVCLCGFYYVNIVSFKNHFLSQLKQRIADVVNYMLILSVLISLTISIPVPWNISRNSNTQASTNVTNIFSSVNERQSPISPQYLLTASMFGCCLPLVLVGVANAFVLRALCINVRLLQRNSSGISIQTIEASISAVRTITCILLIYFCFYVAVISLFLNIVLLGSTWFPLCVTVIYSYSPVQSIILILGSPKLRSASMKLLILIKAHLGNPSNVEL